MSSILKNLQPRRDRQARLVCYVLLLALGTCLFGANTPAASSATPQSYVLLCCKSSTTGKDDGEIHLDTIDVVFVPEASYVENGLLDETQFRIDVTHVITSVFLQTEGVKNNVDKVSFWYWKMPITLTPGANSSCAFANWPIDRTDVYFADSLILLHNKSTLDCTRDIFATATLFKPGGIIHEFSHAAFKLPDEYCCIGNYKVLPPMLYRSASTPTCGSDSTNSGWRHCLSFVDAWGITWWRSEGCTNDVMSAPGKPRQYGEADWVLIKPVLAALGTGVVTDPSNFAVEDPTCPN